MEASLLVGYKSILLHLVEKVQQNRLPTVMMMHEVYRSKHSRQKQESTRQCFHHLRLLFLRRWA
jgi:hypothetical protein